MFILVLTILFIVVIYSSSIVYPSFGINISDELKYLPLSETQLLF